MTSHRTALTGPAAIQSGDFGLFTEKKEIAHSIGEFKQYTDEELVQILEHEAQALLGHHRRT